MLSIYLVLVQVSSLGVQQALEDAVTDVSVQQLIGGGQRAVALLVLEVFDRGESAPLEVSQAAAATGCPSYIQASFALLPTCAPTSLSHHAAPLLSLVHAGPLRVRWVQVHSAADGSAGGALSHRAGCLGDTRKQVPPARPPAALCNRRAGYPFHLGRACQDTQLRGLASIPGLCGASCCTPVPCWTWDGRVSDPLLLSCAAGRATRGREAWQASCHLHA